MNFNRRDSLKTFEVLNDPQFVEFLKKWELTRNPNLIRALFGSNLVNFILFWFSILLTVTWFISLILFFVFLPFSWFSLPCHTWFSTHIQIVSHQRCRWAAQAVKLYHQLLMLKRATICRIKFQRITKFHNFRSSRSRRNWCYSVTWRRSK